MLVFGSSLTLTIGVYIVFRLFLRGPSIIFFGRKNIILLLVTDSGIVASVRANQLSWISLREKI